VSTEDGTPSGMRYKRRGDAARLRSFSLARLFFFVVVGKLLKIVSFEYMAAVEAGHVIDSITPHQKL
jgi:hypothetical protein